MTDDLEKWLGEIPALRCVVPVGRELRIRGGRLVVTSVEIWGDRVHWHMARFPAPDLDETQAEYEMTDAAGTTFRQAGSGGHGDGRWWSEFVTFQPAPPLDVRELGLAGGPLLPGACLRVVLPA